MSALLEACGGRDDGIEQAGRPTTQACQALEMLFPKPTFNADALYELTGQLLNPST